MISSLLYRYFIKILAITFCISQNVFAQPAVEWDKTIGSNGIDLLYQLLLTTDGGYILSGFSTGEAGIDKTKGTIGTRDIWIVKISSNGTKEWDQTINALYNEAPSDIQQTADGGYIIASATDAGAGWDKSENSNGSFDYWIIKLNASGIKEWDKTIGGSGRDVSAAIQQTPDGGYIVGGQSDSPAGRQKSENSKGSSDYWIIKLSSDGELEWDRTIGGTGYEYISTLQLTKDNGFILAGASGPTIRYGNSEELPDKLDYWLVKLSSNGTVQWEKIIGSERDDQLMSMSPTSDGGYIMTGSTDFSGPYIPGESHMNYASWVVKTDAAGTIEWDKILAGGRDSQNYDVLSEVREHPDGSFILGGNSHASAGNDKSDPSNGLEDYWIVKLTSDGTKVWDKIYGGNNREFLGSFQLTPDGGLILGGNTNSEKGYDKSEDSKGLEDFWIVKLRGNQPPLPVTLTAFTAHKENTTSMLIWQTTSETRSDRFEVEHSMNGKSWTILTTITAQGESRGLHAYQYTHNTPNAGDNFYRLKMVDTDGTFTYSSIKFINIELCIDVTVFPNPTSTIIDLQIGDWSKVSKVQVYNSQGHVLYISDRKLKQDINTKAFATGLYFVKVSLIDGSEKTKTVVIKR